VFLCFVMSLADNLTPLDYVLDICMLQIPKLITVDTMLHYQLPLACPIFVDSVWGPVFSWLLTRDIIMRAPDLRAHFIAKLNAHIRNLHTLAIVYEGSPNPGLRAERSVYEQVCAGLMVRTQPPSPLTTWEDVVHLLSTCADLASHVRLFASLGHSVSSKAVLLGEMLGVVCSEHRALLSRGAAPVYKPPAGDPLSNARGLCPGDPVVCPVFGPCVGWDLRGACGGDPGVFNGFQGDGPGGQSDARGWSVAGVDDACLGWGARSPWPPIGPPPKAGSARCGRRRLREADDHVEARPPPASR
jgi:hypothetical protein